MKITKDKHICTYKNAFSKEWCEYLINIYEHSPEKYSRQEAEGVASLWKDDVHVPESRFPKEMINSFKEYMFTNIIPHYNNEYTVVGPGEERELLKIIDFKVQKTLPSQGYHVWHYENGNVEYAHRVLTWTVYLNDIKEGGETEFLHQSKRVTPEQGSVVIFPAAFTHIHRGNPPLSGEKYIITGWIGITK